MTKRIILCFMAFSFALSLFAQTGSIKGNVKSADGKPVEFVSVGIKNSSKGSTTDKSGNFIIKNIKAGTYTIFTSYIGLEKQEKQVTVEVDKVVEVNFTLNQSSMELSEIIITDSKTNPLYKETSKTVAKLPLKDIENPQVYNSVSEKLLKEQVVTNFNDALKNATGITRLWESTGRGGDGAEYYSMRGFSVQPTMVNGVPGVNNGALDPANIEAIEVIKGPSGTLYGSPMISYGGLINVTTKKPFETFGGSVSYTVGSFELSRVALDVNTPLSDKVFARINTSYHTQNTFQDAGFKKSFFVAPSFLIKANEKLTFIINTEILESTSANAPMIFLNRSVPLSFNSIELFERNYKKSFTGNDLSMSNPMFGMQAQALYKFSDKWTSQTIISKSTAKTAGYYHYLWDLGDGDSFTRFISKANSQTHTTDVQQNFIGDFKIGPIRNRLLVGVDYYQSNVYNNSNGWVGNGVVTLSDGEDSGNLSTVDVDNLLIGTTAGASHVRNEIMSAYISDVINFFPTLSVMASVRVDNFRDYSLKEHKDQMAISPKFGFVFQPIKDKVSVFANYMNGFVNVAPRQVADANGANPRVKAFDPENANQYEAGIKTNIYKNKIAATVSYYNILVSNKLMTDPTNVNNSIQGGEVESKGYEFSLVANPVSGLNIVAGYSLNESEVVKDNPENGYLNFRPEEAGPKELINFWVSYTLQTTKLKGLGVGFGGNTASEHLTMNRETTGTFALPAYQIFNASLSYSGTNYSIIFKANNLADQKYYSGWSTVTPQQLRNFSINLTYNF